MAEAFPGKDQVAVFDTSFHQSLPPPAYRYAVPDAFYQEHKVRKYGFHGTSHRYIISQVVKKLGNINTSTRINVQTLIQPFHAIFDPPSKALSTKLTKPRCRLFFSTSPKKLKDEKTQNSREKLRTQAQNSRFRQIW